MLKERLQVGKNWWPHLIYATKQSKTEHRTDKIVIHNFILIF